MGNITCRVIQVQSVEIKIASRSLYLENEQAFITIGINSIWILCTGGLLFFSCGILFLFNFYLIYHYRVNH